MRLLNTLSKSVEELKPVDGTSVGIYQCGPTVYWSQQLGNLRAYTLVDFFVRAILINGYKPLLVRNYTDVGHLTGDNIGDADSGEDRMLKAVKRENLTPETIAAKYIAEFQHDTSLLRILKPHYTPKATEHIQEMIEMISVLLESGFAYKTNLAIYFDTAKKENYTKLSGQLIDQLSEGFGHGHISDTEKKHPTDFALWFFKAGAHADALQTWENPFDSRQGFPGWHIECSAMAKKYLGTTCDIHIGGVEHIPVHHTNEIAQSESCNGVPLANIWLHYEHLLYDGKKMSKSEGTSLLLSDVISKGFSPLDLRYFFLQAQYRSKQNFTWNALDAAKTARRRLLEKLPTVAPGSIIESFKEEFLNRINEDFNFPHALALVKDVLESGFDDADKRATLEYFDQIFDLGICNPEVVYRKELSSEILELLEKRKTARLEQNWTLSDQLRDAINDVGYNIKDLPNGEQVIT